MLSSLRARLWLTYLLLILVILGAIGGSLLLFGIRYSGYIQAENKLRVAASVLDTRLADLPSWQIAVIQRAAERIDANQKVRVLLLSGSGEVLVDSRAGSAPGFVGLRPPFHVQTEAQITPLFLRDASGNQWLYRIASLADGSYLMVAIPRPKINLSLQGLLADEFLLAGFRAGAVALVLSLILVGVMGWWIASPLRRMAAAAGAVARGEFKPIPLEGPGEVQQLARSFNEMTNRVQIGQKSQRDFVANVSHELKTPLTSIQGFAQAILDGTASTPEGLQQAASVIYSEAGRMNRLVLDLLTLARLDAGTANLKREPLDLGALLRGAAEKLIPQARDAQVDLRVDLPPLNGILGDEDRLAQVFTNLLDNAIKYTGAGGRILLTARQTAEMVEVSVADNGPGLSPEDQAQIFERFYQADKSRRGGGSRGVGLGLAIAREIVQAHGGTIAVASAPGKGSNFVVRFPVVRSEDAALARRTK